MKGREKHFQIKEIHIQETLTGHIDLSLLYPYKHYELHRLLKKYHDSSDIGLNLGMYESQM